MKKFLCALLILALALPVCLSAGAASSTENRDIIYHYLTETLGYSRAAAVGILSNIRSESNYNPESKGDKQNGEYTSFGICQWHLGRGTAMKNYCKSNGFAETDIIGQLGYLAKELGPGGNRVGVGNYMKTVPDTAQGAYDAAYKFCVSFEAPANPKDKGNTRGIYAVNTLYPMYGGTINEYTIRFDSEGSSGAPMDCTKREGIPLTLPTQCPVRPGYAFAGWAETAGAEQEKYKAGDSYTKNSDAVLYAVWTPCDENGLLFEPSNGNRMVKGYVGTSAQVTIPAYVDVYQVIGIAAGAFTNSQTPLTVLVPESVLDIEEGAFGENVTVAAPLGSAAYNYAGDHHLNRQCWYPAESTLTLPAEISMLEESAFEGTKFLYADLANTGLYALPDGCFKDSKLKQIRLNSLIGYIAPDALPAGVRIVVPKVSEDDEDSVSIKYIKKFAEDNGYECTEE